MPLLLSAYETNWYRSMDHIEVIGAIKLNVLGHVYEPSFSAT